MMSLYTGTPGSGKSLNCAQLIMRWNKLYRTNIISVNLKLNKQEIYKDVKKYRYRLLDKRYRSYKRVNKVNVNYFNVPRNKRGVIYNIMDFNDISPDFFYRYALRFHKKGREHQTLIIVDEAQMFFSQEELKTKNQEWKEYWSKKFLTDEEKLERRNAPYRNGYLHDWIEFFTHHRHMGFDIVLISQYDKLISAKVRACFEYNFVHRKVNNYGAGFILTLFGISCFIVHQHWYGAHVKCGVKFFIYHKRYAKIYDSYKLFDEIKFRFDRMKIENQIENMNEV